MFNVLSNFKYNSFIKVDKCLTYNMEFVLRKYGTPEWNDVEYVMPLFDVNRANDIIKHE